MDKALIHEYFKKGIDKGLSIDYVREVLLSKGYDQAAVDYVYRTLTGGGQYGVPERKQLPSQGSRWLRLGPIFLLALIALFAGYMLFFGNNGITGMAVQDQDERLNQINELDRQIEQKSTSLQLEIEQLRQANITIEEKNRRIGELVVELDGLHKSISEEHDQVRSLLWDLLKTILKRGEKTAVQQAAGQQATGTEPGMSNPELY